MSMIRKKVILVGDKSGKTSVLLRFVQDHFFDEDISVKDDYYEVDITIEGKRVQLVLVETSSQEQPDRPYSYLEASVIIILFSVIDPASFQSVLIKWVPELNHFCSNVPIILVGNKLDLRNDPEIINELKRNSLKPIEQKEGKAMAKKIGALTYMECSAKTKEGIIAVFETATKIALLSKRKKIKSNVKCNSINSFI